MQKTGNISTKTIGSCPKFTLVFLKFWRSFKRTYAETSKDTLNRTLAFSRFVSALPAFHTSKNM